MSTANPSLSATFADSIRTERLRLGWTQIDVAQRAGMSRATYARFESGGTITLNRLLGVLQALGLTFSIDLNPEPDATAAPRLRARQRGVRRTPTEAKPAAESVAATPTPAPATSAPQPIRSKRPEAPAETQPTVDPAVLAAVRKRHRDSIYQTVHTIVTTPLNNYRAGSVLRNVMSTKHDLDDTGRVAFVAAVDAELARINSANGVEYSVSPREFEAWSKVWNPQLGIVDACRE